MSLRLIGAVGASAILTQAALAFTPPPIPASERGPSSGLVLVQAQPAHAAIGWAKERLSEIDATITTLEEDSRKLDSDARARADATLQKLRTTRDAYRAEVERAAADTGQKTQAQIAETRAALEKRWNEFELGVGQYLTSVNSEVGIRRAVFQARLEAEQRSWAQAIDDLKKSATSAAAQQRAAIDAQITQLGVQADTAKARLAKLEQAGNETWSALRDSLADARGVFDKTYDAIQTAIERAKQ